MSKYGNKRIVTEDGEFDSNREFTRWCELKLLQRAGEITGLKRQVKIMLLPSQRDELGKVIEKPVHYIADFVYTENGKQIVEDAKGFRTKEYILKRKMLLYLQGIQIKEV